MDVRDLPFSGHYEQVGDVSETLQVAVPESENEQVTLKQELLAEPTVLTADSARRGYSFRYEVVEYLGDGLFGLRIDAEDASGRTHTAEIAAGVTLSADPAAAASDPARLPMWFISRKHHYKRSDDGDPGYPGPCFGRLDLADPDQLPHRRLFQGLG